MAPRQKSRLDPAKLPVVVINGLGAPHVAAATYARLLGGRGLEVHSISPTRLGFGDIRVAAERVDAFIDELRERTGAPKVRLVGMSLGGLIGLYYVKCAGGASKVERFISVGGPLNGSRLACIGQLPPLRGLRALSQICRYGKLVDEVRGAPAPKGVRMISVGTRGDVVTMRHHWEAEGLETVKTPHGVFPIGHWCLFLMAGNRRVVAELLQAA